MITWHRWVRFPLVDAYMRLGWLPAQTLRGTYHGQWAVHMIWLCDCELIEPKQ